MRLLVVDDNAVNRELICALLSPFDLEIETAQDGVEFRNSARLQFHIASVLESFQPAPDETGSKFF